MLRHKHTESTGRWNLICLEKDFRSVVNSVKEQLRDIYDRHLDNQTISEDTSHFPEVGLAFKNQIYDDDSDGSFTSYVSMCESMFTVDNDNYNLPPATNRPVPQAWAPPDSVQAPIRHTATHVSSITETDKVTRLENENERLTRQMADMATKIADLQKNQSRTASPPKSTPPKPSSRHSSSC